jgi:hypothetical protein
VLIGFQVIYFTKNTQYDLAHFEWCFDLKYHQDGVIMHLVVLLFTLTMACSTHHVQQSSLMGSHIHLLRQTEALIADSNTPILLEAAIRVPSDQMDKILIEWWSQEDGLLAVHQPDIQGRDHFSTSTLSSGIHTIYVKMKVGDLVIHHDDITLYIQSSTELADDIIQMNDLGLQNEFWKQSELVTTQNRLSGCDENNTSVNYWFCPDYTQSN